MPATQVRSGQLGDGEVRRDDVNTTTTGQALVRKVLAGNTSLTATSDGADAGTGDVSLNVNLANAFTWTGVHVFNRAIRPGVVTLTDATTIATDVALGNAFKVTITASRTLGAPSNPVDGQVCTWEIIQNATGGWTLTLDTGAGGFAFSTDLPSGSVSVSTTANSSTFITARYSSAKARWCVLACNKGF